MEILAVNNELFVSLEGFNLIARANVVYNSAWQAINLSEAQLFELLGKYDATTTLN